MSDERKRGDAPGGPFDGAMRAAILGVAASAVVITASAAIGFGARAALGVAIGGAIATANLYVFARIGDVFISRRGRVAPWAVIAVLKLGALLGGVYFILRSGIVSGLALTIGYSSLVVGITLGTLFGPKPPEDDGDPGGGAPPDAPEDPS